MNFLLLVMNFVRVVCCKCQLFAVTQWAFAGVLQNYSRQAQVRKY